MKKKSQVLLSSITTIALSAALIAGSTFALFTSESNTDISITSGNVGIEASVKKVDAYSAKWQGGKYVDDTTSVTVTNDTSGTFANGGTYTYDSGKKSLTLDRVSPGDGVNIQIDVTNTSSISIKYQTVVTFVSGGSADADPTDDPALFKALNITVAGDDGMENISSDRLTAVSGWSSPVNPNTNFGPINVSIELPMETGDALQAMQCEMLISVYAVQSNGHDETNQNVYLVSKDSNLTEVLDNLQDGDILSFTEDFEQSDKLSVGGKEVTADLGGHTLTLDVGGSIVADTGASLTLTGGKISVGEENAETKANFLIAQCSEGTATLNIDCTVDLDNACDDAFGQRTDYFGIFASATGTGKSIVNITENANISQTLQYGSLVGAGAGGEINMNGGNITYTQEGNSGNTASAVYLTSSAVFNMSGGTITAGGHNVAAVNVSSSAASFIMEGGKILLNADLGGLTTGWVCSAVEASGKVSLTGGSIEVGSTIPAGSKAYACALYSTSVNNIVTILENAKIIVYKDGGKNGSNRNYVLLYGWDEKVLYDESGETAQLPKGAGSDITNWENWTLEGTIELRRA